VVAEILVGEQMKLTALVDRQELFQMGQTFLLVHQLHLADVAGSVPQLGQMAIVGAERGRELPLPPSRPRQPWA
jgi:hypothetical protein